MKKIISNCLATTALTLIILTIVASLYKANFLCLSSVYQVLFVNILIHISLILLRKLENKYFLIEVAIEIGDIVVILLVFGFIFKWYAYTSIWVVVLIGIAVYIIGCFINIIKINNDISFINNQLKLLKAKKK